MNVGVSSEVIWSVVFNPRSELMSSDGAVGAWGVVLIVTLVGGELPELSPAAFSILTKNT